MKDIIYVETEDVPLICSMDRAQDIKFLLKKVGEGWEEEIRLRIFHPIQRSNPKDKDGSFILSSLTPKEIGREQQKKMVNYFLDFGGNKI